MKKTVMIILCSLSMNAYSNNGMNTLLTKYNNAEEREKVELIKKEFNQTTKFFTKLKKENPDNVGVPLISGDISKVVFTFKFLEEKEELTQKRINDLIKSFTEGFQIQACSTEPFNKLVGLDIPIEGVVMMNNKVITRIPIEKRNCPALQDYKTQKRKIPAILHGDLAK